MGRSSNLPTGAVRLIMKKFTGQVVVSQSDLLLVNKKQTWVYIYYKNNNAPIFEKYQIVIVKSKQDFPIVTSTWTNEHEKLITDRVRGQVLYVVRWY